MADQYYDWSDLVPRGERIYEAAGSSVDPYIVDMKNGKCTCTAWAMNRNRAVSDPVNYQATCKHHKAAIEYEKHYPPSTLLKEAAKRKAKEAEEEEAAMDFARIRMIEQAKKELEALRKDL